MVKPVIPERAFIHERVEEHLIGCCNRLFRFQTGFMPAQSTLAASGKKLKKLSARFAGIFPVPADISHTFLPLVGI